MSKLLKYLWLIMCSLLPIGSHALSVSTPQQSVLTPVPAGFTKSFSGVMGVPSIDYRCENGTWVSVGASAKFFGISGPDTTATSQSVYNSSVTGIFQSVHDRGMHKLPTLSWTINNSVGDAMESLGSTSGVACTTDYFSVDMRNETQWLCEVTSHQGSGIASMVSYVGLSSYNPGSLGSPCQNESDTSSDQFRGIFTFYMQNMQPPTDSIPPSLMPPSTSHVIEGDFVKGHIPYKFDGKIWRRASLQATIYDVAGGSVLGTVQSIRQNLQWNFTAPGNELQLTGNLIGKPVHISEDALPWQMMSITNSFGSTSLPYKYAQLTSTRGGLPPTTSTGIKAGDLWMSPFTGLFWFYSA